MTTARLEAFSDGVIAILITIMVLELKIPHGATAAALRPVLPALMAYLFSFVVVGIYWNNHHHMFHLVDHLNGAILWANLVLLFFLSLIPVATAWIGSNGAAAVPTAVYGCVLLGAAIAYFTLVNVIIWHQGPDSKLAAAVKRDFKGKISVVIYAVAIPLAWVRPWLADACYVTVTLMWLIPDPRIESRVHHRVA